MAHKEISLNNNWIEIRIEIENNTHNVVLIDKDEKFLIPKRIVFSSGLTKREAELIVDCVHHSIELGMQIRDKQLEYFLQKLAIHKPVPFM